MFWSAFMRSCSLFVVLSLVVMVAVGLTTGCGGGSRTPPPPKGNTQVTVALTSSANDQLSQFDLGFESLTLTSKSGNTVTLQSSTDGQPAEFIHLNGGVEPLTTATVAQDVYTSAIATIGGSQFTCVTLTPQGGLDTSTFAYGYTPSANVTVTLPSPITITGDSMGLSLDLMVSQSAAYSSCYYTGIVSFSITPTFTLTPVAFSTQPTNPENGLVLGLNGQITAIDAASSSIMLSVPEPNIENTTTLSVSASGSTIYQGIGDFSALAVGMFVNADGGIQSDGSLSATRIAVEDTSAVDFLTGPVMQVAPYEPGSEEIIGVFFNRLSGGQDPTPLAWEYSIENAVFQISGQQNNLQTLPFVPSFTLSNVVPGQNVYVSSPTLQLMGGTYTPANTITLMPQSIDATVAASSVSGSFTDYTVTLAPYDLFPTLAAQLGIPTLLSDPSQIEVYVDSNTQMLNSQPLGVGGTFRFYGLVFNDNGTLRMDCAQVNDGVSEAQSSGTQRGQLQPGAARVTRRSVGHGQSMRNVIIRQMER
jgi:hypothetical protein